jgi:hypothetical protein
MNNFSQTVTKLFLDSSIDHKLEYFSLFINNFIINQINIYLLHSLDIFINFILENWGDKYFISVFYYLSKFSIGKTTNNLISCK